MSNYILDLRKIVGHRTLIQVGASIIVEDDRGRVLLQLRADNHCWSYCGGSMEIDEQAEETARRELLEETGISAMDLMEIGRYTSHDTIYYNYLCVTDCEKTSVSLQEGETVSYKWVSENDFIAFVNSDEMIDIQKERYHKYFLKMGYVR